MSYQVQDNVACTRKSQQLLKLPSNHFSIKLLGIHVTTAPRIHSLTTTNEESKNKFPGLRSNLGIAWWESRGREWYVTKSAQHAEKQESILFLTSSYGNMQTQK